MEYAGLLAGLGNPGEKYRGTRHNCGFMLISLFLEMAAREGEVEELGGKKFNSLLWRARSPWFSGIWLAAMPQTFMNDSGMAIQPLLAWHKLRPEQLVVAHDELDLPPGALRLKFGGGIAGHKGLSSISRFLGGGDYYRLRIGIGKPAHKSDMLGWVLGRPDGVDKKAIQASLPLALETFSIFTREGAGPAAGFARSALKQIAAAGE